MGTVKQIRYKGHYEIVSHCACCGNGNYKLKDMNSNKVLEPYTQTTLKQFYVDYQIEELELIDSDKCYH